MSSVPRLNLGGRGIEWRERRPHATPAAPLWFLPPPRRAWSETGGAAAAEEQQKRPLPVSIEFFTAAAPPPESDAAIVHTIGSGALLEMFFIDWSYKLIVPKRLTHNGR